MILVQPRRVQDEAGVSAGDCGQDRQERPDRQGADGDRGGQKGIFVRIGVLGLGIGGQQNSPRSQVR